MIWRDPFGDKPTPAAEDNPKERDVQLFLQSTQEQALAYARVHLPAVLDEELGASVRELEHQYRMKPNLRAKAPRGRVPWPAYRKTVLKHLPRETGGYQPGCALTTRREGNEAATTWVKRITSLEKF